MDYQSMYRAKLKTAEQAVEVVRSGHVVEYGHFNGKPVACDHALAQRADSLKDVQIHCALTLPPVPETPMKPQSFIYNDWQFSKITRMLQENGLAYYSPILYHEAPTLLRDKAMLKRDVVIAQVCPMDEKGYFNLGPQNSETLAKMDVADTVIVEVNPQLPVCLGGSEESVHISRVDGVVEAFDNPGPFCVPDLAPSEEEKRIAEHVVSHLKDGSCIQLGIGGLPNAVGRLIAESDLKDLGGHTEMFSDAYVDLLESGRMTGSQKSLDRFRVPFTFAVGSKRMYDFLHNNPAVASYTVSYTNDPRVICRHDNFVSVCNAVQVDLYSQVNAESIGPKQISGNGGMWDFVQGSQWSRGGKSFICLTSTFKDKDGTARSRIVPYFEPCSITTIPRQMVDYIVTEFGAVQLKSQPTWKRAELLVSIAHPDFRETLIREAEKMKIWRKSS